MNKEELQVAALQNGTVIDHIPTDKLFTIVSLLGLKNSDLNITIGNNLPSEKLGKKGIIKVADRFFTDEEISRLSVVAPNVQLNIIHNYEVVEKKQVIMPDEIRGIVKCRMRRLSRVLASMSLCRMYTSFTRSYSIRSVTRSRCTRVM